jgi:hypothetical protein
MKFILKNDSPRMHMGLLPGQGVVHGSPREVSAEEMQTLAGPLSKAMQPVEHYLYTGPTDPGDLTKGTASLHAFRAQPKRLQCTFVDDDGKTTELTGPELAEMFKEEIAAQKKAREDTHKERIAARRKMFTR